MNIILKLIAGFKETHNGITFGKTGKDNDFIRFKARQRAMDRPISDAGARAAHDALLLRRATGRSRRRCWPGAAGHEF